MGPTLTNYQNFFDRLSEAKLTDNFTKSECCHANLAILGDIVGQGQVS